MSVRPSWGDNRPDYPMALAGRAALCQTRSYRTGSALGRAGVWKPGRISRRNRLEIQCACEYDWVTRYRRHSHPAVGYSMATHFRAFVLLSLFGNIFFVGPTVVGQPLAEEGTTRKE